MKINLPAVKGKFGIFTLISKNASKNTGDKKTTNKINHRLKINT